MKENVLCRHWHITDTQSWPLQSKTFPLFSSEGAYRPDYIYTHADVKEIVAYAWERGIRVVPELDMPAHANVWGLAYPRLVIKCPGHQTLLDPTDTDADFNVYSVVDKLLTEFDPLFNTTGGFFHIGGDEVHDMTCWETSRRVQAWMQTKGLVSVRQVRQYFENRMQKVVQAHQKDAILWEEVFDDGYAIDKSSVVNAWLSSVVPNVTAHGYRVVYNYGWYLDQQVPPGGTHYLWGA